MNYGCIGERLGHSFSKEIHNLIYGYEYELCEVRREELDTFMTKPNFCAINVTIPYKEAVIPYMHCIDESASSIGAINTVVNRDGRLYGYNTDFYGMQMLIERVGVDLLDKKVVILGTGGTSRTAMAVARGAGAREILRVSRAERADAISYSELYASHTDADVIINTTPVGTFPNISHTPIRLDGFGKLKGVIDVVYNPLRTELISRARELNVPAESGLYMLVAQAVRASEIFLDKKYPDAKVDEVYEKVFKSKENIVLIGMPSSGKSTVGALLAERLGRRFVDTDILVRERAGMEIPEIFERYGEAHFRELEAEAVKEASLHTSLVVATGGGVPMRPENVRALKQNGRIFFLDRPLENLLPTSDRPLTSTKDSLVKIYNQRYGIYQSAADTVIDASGDAESVALRIEGSIK